MKQLLLLALAAPFVVSAAEINPGFSFRTDGQREVASEIAKHGIPMHMDKLVDVIAH